ncbi:MAG: hypothetical protein CL885_03150 [Dehalococcoidia bacterium]|nr:hypothetical protein [Dehalococcoidia bacterium]|tara:strand:+ start:700 stop:1023 length:324 start_codon:yes stop_codon:yes gene_type:complete
MLKFLKKAFGKKKEPPAPKPEKLLKTISDIVLCSVNTTELIDSFPKESKEGLTRQLNDGLQALKGHDKIMKKAQREVNLIKINNLFKIITKYGSNIKTCGVFIINEK